MDRKRLLEMALTGARQETAEIEAELATMQAGLRRDAYSRILASVPNPATAIDGKVLDGTHASRAAQSLAMKLSWAKKRSEAACSPKPRKVLFPKGVGTRSRKRIRAAIRETIREQATTKAKNPARSLAMRKAWAKRRRAAA